MKRILIVGLMVWLGSISILPAQNDASAAADRQAATELTAQLTGKLQDLSEAQDALHRQIEGLQKQIGELRDQQSKPAPDVVQRDEFRKLAEQVKDIDDKRAADKELILKEIAKLANVPAAPVKTPKAPKAAVTPDSGPADAPATTTNTTDSQNYEGYQHVVKSGETLIAIIKAYNKEYDLKLTVDQVLKHPLNAKVKPEKLYVGQKVFIPAK